MCTVLTTSARSLCLLSMPRSTTRTWQSASRVSKKCTRTWLHATSTVPWRQSFASTMCCSNSMMVTSYGQSTEMLTQMIISFLKVVSLSFKKVAHWYIFHISPAVTSLFWGMFVCAPCILHLTVFPKQILPHTSCPHSEVQQFRDEVRNSPEVKFAVHAFAAVNSNNFVRFFKLVKGASYLASCLLHRYFNQVRNCLLHLWLRLKKTLSLFKVFFTSLEVFFDFRSMKEYEKIYEHLFYSCMSWIQAIVIIPPPVFMYEKYMEIWFMLHGTASLYLMVFYAYWYKHCNCRY